MKSAEAWARECVEGEPYWEAVGATAQEERIGKFIGEARNEALEAAAAESEKWPGTGMDCIVTRGRTKAGGIIAAAIRKLKDET